MKRFGVITVALCLAACVDSRMREGYHALEGQPIDAAIKKLGYPASEQKIAGDTVYTWTVHMDANMQCALRIGTGDDRIIKNASYDGNNGACAVFSDRLNR